MKKEKIKQQIRTDLLNRWDAWTRLTPKEVESLIEYVYKEHTLGYRVGMSDLSYEIANQISEGTWDVDEILSEVEYCQLNLLKSSLE